MACVFLHLYCVTKKTLTSFFFLFLPPSFPSFLFFFSLSPSPPLSVFLSFIQGILIERLLHAKSYAGAGILVLTLETREMFSTLSLLAGPGPPPTSGCSCEGKKAWIGP